MEKKQNYLVYNKREKGKWIKKSKFMGSGNIPKKQVERLKKDFEKEIFFNKKYQYLDKKQVKEIEELKKSYNKKNKTILKRRV